MVMMIECESVVRGCAFRSDRSGIDRHKTPRTNMRQWERDGSCFDHLSPCLSQFYCWLPRRIRQQRRGYASRGIFTMAEADFTTTESTRKQVPCGPGERSRRSHMGQGLPPGLHRGIRSPRPHRRCWPARADLSERWPARLVETAEEDCLNIRAQSVHFFCGNLGDTKVRVLINAQIAAPLLAR